MRIILFFFAALSSLFSQAQDTEGVITYKQTVKIEIPEETKQRMLDYGIQMDFPDENVSTKTLIFNKKESVYQNQIKEDEGDEFTSRRRGGRVVMMSFRGGSENKFYRDVEENEIVQQREIQGKLFRIEDTQDTIAWKMTGRQAQLGNYLAMEATYQTEKDTVLAWFTPQIPVSSGPGKYAQLPGMVLRVDINNGKRVIEATNIEIRALKEDEIERPTSGKKVTQEEFDEIQEKKLQELKDLYGEERAGRIMKIE